jgi:serine/threonine-protein kinase
MPRVSGEKLGPYEILAPIGAGGMGEVYRARDPRMGREVAIKICAERFSDRFDREVHAVAALNHPNICHIYDVGPNYLVMELVEGCTLADRIKGGPLPLEETLIIARQTADALEGAHEKGIIHRDLKPGNIKITPEGVVKVLDFGLAKMPEAAATAQNPENSPTLTIESTRAGLILGTAAYMAPEQACGKHVDKRADIWSWGVVLWEMLTGRRLFHGDETVAHTLAEVMRAEIDFARLPPATPTLIRDLLQRCLERDVTIRLRDIGEARIAIQKYLANPAAMAALPASPPRRAMAWAVAGTLALALIVLSVLLWRATRPTDRSLVRLDVDLGPDVSLGSFAGANAILSPDGLRMVYVSHNRLFTRRLDQLQSTELPGTEGADAPFFSADGQWIAFFAENKLKKLSVAGGATAVLCNAPSGLGGSWGEDNVITAALNVVGGLSRIPANGGAPSPLTELDRARGETTHRWPQFLPGGKAVLFTAHSQQVSAFDEADIKVMALRDRHQKTLVRGGTYGRYLPTGHLLYVNRGTLFAVPFDIGSLEVRGSPVSLLNQVAYDISGGARFEVSQTGTLVYETGGAQDRSVSLDWLESDGRTRALLRRPGNYGRPSFSPDGQRLAMDIADGSRSDIWIYDLRRDGMARLTWDGNVNQLPVWTPDGRYIVFQDQEGLSWTRADGAGKPQTLLRTKSTTVQMWSFAPDGKRLAYFELDPGTAFHLWTVPLESNGVGLRAGQPEVFLQTSSDERHPSFSPDGHWLAYSSTESGAFQVYVRAFPDKGGKWQISNAGGFYPTWSRVGHELFFESPDNRIMVVNYTVDADSFVPDKPRVWSEARLANLGLFKNFDLAPDGKRIAALIPAEGGEAKQLRHHVVFLMNFFDELRRGFPLNK